MPITTRRRPYPADLVTVSIANDCRSAITGLLIFLVMKLPQRVSVIVS